MRARKGFPRAEMRCVSWRRVCEGLRSLLGSELLPWLRGSFREASTGLRLESPLIGCRLLLPISHIYSIFATSKRFYNSLLEAASLPSFASKEDLKLRAAEMPRRSPLEGRQQESAVSPPHPFIHNSDIYFPIVVPRRVE